jgi:hypothetical protein
MRQTFVNKCAVNLVSTENVHQEKRAPVVMGIQKIVKINISAIRSAVRLVAMVDVQHQRRARVIQAFEKIPKISTNAMRSAVKLA